MKEAKNASNSIFKDIFKKFGLFLILIILMGIMGILSKYFFTIGNLLTIGVQASVNAILGIGMLMVIIQGGIDLSIGAILALSGIVAAYLMKSHVPVILSLSISIVIAGLLGWINGFLVTGLKLQPFIATLGTTGIFRGIALVATGGLPISSLPEQVSWFGAGNIIGIPVPIFLTILIIIIFSIILNHSLLGRYMYSIGSNAEATRLCGIKIDRYRRIIYTIEGALAGVAGVILIGRLCVAQPNAATGYELNAIAATVIGGTSMMGGSGTIMGTIIGALIMSVLSNGFTLLGMNTFIQQVAIGIVLIAAVYFDALQRKRQ